MAPTLRVQTTIGAVEGSTSPTWPGVAQWLGLPFAEPPIGPKRFAAPVAKTPLPAGEVLEAHTMPPAAQQAFTTKPDVYARHLPEFLATGPYSEDCLYLNIFAPAGAQRDEVHASSGLPVFLWLHGGEFSWGGINGEYYQPHQWVQRSQEHIVVTISYRLGIFGFPNSKVQGEVRNLGMLDQRLALEWLRSNISAFGGDPTRMTAFGSAAGSASWEAHLFAWPDDPIFSRIISQSGFVFMGRGDLDPDRASFTTAARKMGCLADATPEQEVDFLRSVNAPALAACITSHNDAGEAPRLHFRPLKDGKVIFTPVEYRRKAAAGEFAKMPMMLGTTADEGAALAPYQRSGVPVKAITTWNGVFLKAVAEHVKFRHGLGLLTYQYRYEGVFENTSPLAWLKSYHFSEIPLIMGTYDITRGPASDFQRSLSAAMQDMWLAFGRDPVGGLCAKPWGWRPVNLREPEDTVDIMVLGRGEITHQMETTALVGL